MPETYGRPINYTIKKITLVRTRFSVHHAIIYQPWASVAALIKKRRRCVPQAVDDTERVFYFRRRLILPALLGYLQDTTFQGADPGDMMQHGYSGKICYQHAGPNADGHGTQDKELCLHVGLPV